MTTCLRVAPAQSCIDEQLDVHLSGLAAHESVTLAACAIDRAGINWHSWARFEASAAGTIDVGGQAPGEGSYSGVDPLGLLWSLQPAGTGRRRFFAYRGAEPVTISFSAEVGGEVVARCQIERTFGGGAVSGRPVGDARITGTLFYPRGPGPWPGVLLLGGSDGGQLDRAAALLARRGYAVLALAYFGAQALPRGLVEIELEYFDLALRWLAGQPEVAGPRIVAVGLSRGAELALQLGSMFPVIRAVVAGSPSSVRQPGVGSDYADFGRPAWLYRGSPLPFLTVRPTAWSFLEFAASWSLRRAMRQRPMFQRAMRDRRAVQRAEIEVERICGPVLLVSGTDDQLWPSHEFARQIMTRLQYNDHPYPDEHLSFDGAGHFLCFPYGMPSLPAMTDMTAWGSFTIAFGGTIPGNARAARESWPKILQFLAQTTS